MSTIYRRIFQILIFASLLVVGAWIRALAPSHEIPPPADASTALVIAIDMEKIDTDQWHQVNLPTETFRHQLLSFATEMDYPAKPPYRDYTFLPLFLSVLLLPLIPCLGWKKHGGLFRTSDGPLWGLAFATVSPVAFMGATSLTPFTFQCIAFLLLLLAARSYAIWPGYLSAISMGIIVAGAVTVSAEVVWGLALFFLVIIFGVGWTRFTLYWRTTHVITVVVVAGLGLTLAFLLNALSIPKLPQLETNLYALWMMLKRQVVWLCVYGVGVFAWGGVVAIAIFQKETRWERIVAIFFAISFLLGLFLKDDVGVVFLIPLAVLTPIMVALVLTHCPNWSWRWWMGNIILIGLCFGFIAAMEKSSKPLTIEEGISTVINEELLSLPLAARCDDLAIMNVEREEHISQILWMLRAYASGRSVAVDPTIWDKAMVIVLPETDIVTTTQVEQAGMHSLCLRLSLGESGETIYNVYAIKGEEE